MYRALLSFIFLVVSINLFGQDRQIHYPKLSPYQKTEIKIGVVDFTIEYHRPSMKGRSIFGDLEPLGTIWRTGANKNSKLTISDNIIVAGLALKAGAYSIFTTPNIDEWDVYFYDELDEYGVPEVMDSLKIVIHFTLPKIDLNRDVETLAINFEDITSKSANLVIEWERSQIRIPIEIPFDQIISKTLKSETETLVYDLWVASSIYFDIEKDYSKALEAIDKAILLLEDGRSFQEYSEGADLKNRHIPNKYLLKSEIHAALDSFDKAIEAAEKSLFLADLVDDDYYRKRNEANLEKWEK
jgi:tetratricopeptide (TPR) repeat protein